DIGPERSAIREQRLHGPRELLRVADGPRERDVERTARENLLAGSLDPAPVHMCVRKVCPAHSLLEELTLLLGRLHQVDPRRRPPEPERNPRKAAAASYVQNSNSLSRRNHEQRRQAGKDLIRHRAVDRLPRNEVDALVALAKQLKVPGEALDPV